MSTIKQHSLNGILDVGCGRGIVTDYLFRNEISIQGVELGNATPINNSNVPIHYNTDALTISKEEGRQYNAISLFDVIEHIKDPVGFLKDLVHHFHNVKYLIITVPACQELWSNFDEHYGHYKRYNLKTLENELQEVGFKVIKNRYFFHTLYFLIKLNNKISKKRDIKINTPKGSIKIIHSMLAKLFFMEKFIVPKKFVGSSIICVAKKITNA